VDRTTWLPLIARKLCTWTGSSRPRPSFLNEHLNYVVHFISANAAYSEIRAGLTKRQLKRLHIVEFIVSALVTDEQSLVGIVYTLVLEQITF